MRCHLNRSPRQCQDAILIEGPAHVLGHAVTLLVNSCSGSQGEFEPGKVTDAGAVQRVAVPPGVQPDQVERGGGVGVFRARLG